MSIVTITYNEFQPVSDGEDISAKSIFDYPVEKKLLYNPPLNDLLIFLQVGIGRNGMKPICPLIVYY